MVDRKGTCLLDPVVECINFSGLWMDKVLQEQAQYRLVHTSLFLTINVFLSLNRIIQSFRQNFRSYYGTSERPAVNKKPRCLVKKWTLMTLSYEYSFGFVVWKSNALLGDQHYKNGKTGKWDTFKVVDLRNDKTTNAHTTFAGWQRKKCCCFFKHL